jgi:hypothetical protein
MNDSSHPRRHPADLTERDVLRRWAPGCLVALAATVSVGWLVLRLGTTTFPPFPTEIDVVTVHGLGLDTLRSISDPDSISDLLAFINERTDRWGGISDVFGVPIPLIRVDLYDSQDQQNRGFRGSFGAGNDFFETQRVGTFASRPASTRELEEFARLVGVPVAWFRDGAQTR